MLAITSILLYLGIFFAKLVEVSISTLRVVLINRGQKKLGMVLAFFEVLIWLFVVNAVLKDVTSDYFKVFAYCFAFACGNYVGVSIEEKLAIGMSVVEIVAVNETAEPLVERLREAGYGVTTIDSHGKDNKVTIVRTYIKRKQISAAKEIIHSVSPNLIISVNDVKHVYGGFIKK